jgi:carboxyl-terminal processing protease
MRLTIAIVVLCLVCSVAPVGVDGSNGTALTERHLSELAALCLQLHVSRNELTPSIAAATLTNLVESLDYGKVFFVQSDVDRIYASRVKFPEAFTSRRWPFVKDALDLFALRVCEQLTNSLEYLSDPQFQLEREREVISDPKKRGFPADAAEAHKYLEDTLQYQVGYLVAIGEPLTSAVEKVQSRRERLTRRFLELDESKKLAIFVNAFCRALDPHTAYFTQDDMEDFQINMSLKLEGIGAVLTSEEGVTQIRSLTPGGPAEKSGLVKSGDKIFGVAQGTNSSYVDIYDMDLRDVVRLIRGTKGTVVRLKLVRKAPKGAERLDVALTREEVKLEDQAAQLAFMDLVRTNHSGTITPLRIGVIDLPSFYVDTQSGRHGTTYDRSAVADIRRLLNLCETADVDGVVLDLQRNGGGALDEAVDVAGLFMKRASVVITRDRRGGDSVLEDSNKAVEYTGPVALTVSRATASGAEIVAGALKAYDRALIVGNDHTFGKGTVQQVIPLPSGLGALKVTMGEYFIADGTSPQHEGVTPHIEVLSDFAGLEVGERYDPNALPARQVENRLSGDRRIGAEADCWTRVPPQTVAWLSALSAARVAHSESFDKLRENLAKLEEERSRASITIAELLENVETNAVDEAELEDRPEPLRAPLTNDTVVLEAVQILADMLAGPDAAVAVWAGLESESVGAAAEVELHAVALDGMASNNPACVAVDVDERRDDMSQAPRAMPRAADVLPGD